MIEIVIAYDVADDDRRARLAAYLSRCGVRLQKSVFQCQVAADAVDSLIEGIRAIVEEKSDVVHGFHQCSGCRKRVVEVGQAPVDLGVRYWVV